MTFCKVLYAMHRSAIVLYVESMMPMRRLPFRLFAAGTDTDQEFDFLLSQDYEHLHDPLSRHLHVLFNAGRH